MSLSYDVVSAVSGPRRATPGKNPALVAELAVALAGGPGLPDWAGLTAEHWQALVAQAAADRVAPLLYHRLRQAGWPDWVPAQAANLLRAAYMSTLAKNSEMVRELDRVLEVIEPFAERVVVLKGAALALSLYSSVALRPYSDLDLLVPQSRVAEASDAVRSLGYLENSHRWISPEVNRTLGHHMLFLGGPRGDVQLELHWSLVGSDSAWYSPRLDWFWSQTEPLRPSTGSSALTFAPTAQLLYLAAHLALLHDPSNERLLWYHDIHLLMERESSRVDWEEALARAREFHWVVAVRRVLEAATGYFGTRLPPDFMQALQAVEDRRSDEMLNSKEGEARTRTAKNLTAWRSLGTRAKIQMAWAMLLPGPDFIQWRYQPRPAWLWPVYYLYRWWDMLGDLYSTLAARLRRQS